MGSPETRSTAYTTLDFNTNIPHIAFDADIRRLDFHQMGLSKKPFFIKGAIKTSTRGLSLDTLNADAFVDDLQISFDSLTHIYSTIRILSSTRFGHPIPPSDNMAGTCSGVHYGRSLVGAFHER